MAFWRSPLGSAWAAWFRAAQGRLLTKKKEERGKKREKGEKERKKEGERKEKEKREEKKGKKT